MSAVGSELAAQIDPVGERGARQAGRNAGLLVVYRAWMADGPPKPRAPASSRAKAALSRARSWAAPLAKPPPKPSRT